MERFPGGAFFVILFVRFLFVSSSLLFFFTLHAPSFAACVNQNAFANFSLKLILFADCAD